MNIEKVDKTISIAMTGASGAPYGLRLIECLVASGANIYLMVSPAGQVVLSMETDLKIPGRPDEMQAWFTKHYDAKPNQIQVFAKDQWMAPVASGSGAPDAMVVCPCTTGTLSSIACGSSNNLIERAADVVIKEQRKLIMVVRETPLSAIHLENMLKLARLGVVMLPATPGFYQNPKSVDDIVDFIVARILEQLDIKHDLLPAWGD
ncbi:MAG: UbiX family flavin prenyltransferase [Sulfuriflexus sp.]|nr:UbiX family flavin prenyltransferase [Sulfuriflexus sp.]